MNINNEKQLVHARSLNLHANVLFLRHRNFYLTWAINLHGTQQTGCTRRSQNTPNEKHLLFLGIRRTISSVDSLKVCGEETKHKTDGSPSTFLRAAIYALRFSSAIKENPAQNPFSGVIKSPCVLLILIISTRARRKTTNDTENIIPSANKSNSISQHYDRAGVDRRLSTIEL